MKLEETKMAHFAQLDENNIVVGVYVFDLEDHETPDGPLPEGHQWIRTSYNHKIRYNFAGVGHIYDPEYDAFHAPQPFPSWILDRTNHRWTPPPGKEHPMDGKLYRWIEEQGGYVLEPGQE